MKFRIGWYAWMSVLLLMIVATGIWNVIGFARIRAELPQANGPAAAATVAGRQVPREFADPQDTREQALEQTAGPQREPRLADQGYQDRISRRYKRVSALCDSHAVGAAVLASLSVLTLLWLAQHLATTVFRPVQRIGRFIERAALGELHLRLSPGRTDRLASLVLACNRLVESLQQLTEESRRRIDTERQLAVILIESFPTPTLAMSGGNDVVLANASARVILSGPQGTEALNNIKEALRHGADHFEAGDIPYHVDRAPAAANRGFPGLLLHFHAQAAPAADPAEAEAES